MARLPKEGASDFAARYRDRQKTIRAIVEGWKMRKPESYASVWDAIADTPGQAANLRARAELMRQIAGLDKEARVDAGRGGATLRGDPATDQRSPPGPRFALLAGCAGEYIHRARVPRAGGSRSRLRHASPPAMGSFRRSGRRVNGWHDAASGSDGKQVHVRRAGRRGVGAGENLRRRSEGCRT